MPSRAIPPAVYLLGLTIFAQGTSELILSGLLPAIASDLKVSIPDAGWLTSGFAIGMGVGAPVLAVLTLRWALRPTLLIFLAVFVASHIVSAVAPNYEILLVSRILGAVVYAGYWAVASVTALSLVPSAVKGKALAIVAGGLTIASILGVPAGTFIGQQWGWRAAFWVIAAMTAVSAIGVLATIPGGRDAAADRPVLRRELRTLANPRLWLALATAAMSSGVFTATFTYAAALLTTVSGIETGWIPLVLALTGLGGLVGITVGGRSSDARPFATLALGFGGALISAAVLAVTSDIAAAAIVALVMLGAFGFATNPAVNVRVFTLAAEAPTLAGAANVVGFNLGITVAPWASGILIGAGFGLTSVAWVSMAIAALGVLAAGWAFSLRHRDPSNSRSEAQAEPALASA